MFKKLSLKLKKVLFGAKSGKLTSAIENKEIKAIVDSVVSETIDEAVKEIEVVAEAADKAVEQVKAKATTEAKAAVKKTRAPKAETTAAKPKKAAAKKAPTTKK